MARLSKRACAHLTDAVNGMVRVAVQKAGGRVMISCNKTSMSKTALVDETLNTIKSGDVGNQIRFEIQTPPGTSFNQDSS